MLRWIILVAVTVYTVNGYNDKNVLQCLRDNGLTDFVQLLEDSAQSSQLAGDGPFTILAPTNDALSSLDPDLLAAFTREDSLVKQVVQYHIIPEYSVLPQLAAAGDVQSLEGQPIRFSGTVSDLLINNASRPVSAEKSDIVCLNGVIHTIDKLLVPPIFSKDNIPTVLVIRDDIFRDITLALLLNNLTNILEGSEFTLFAPTDLAFGRYSELENIPPGTPDAQKIFYEVFKYHVVPGRRTSHQLRDGQKLYTYHGYPIEITITASGMKVDHASIVEVDIPASNGVIHAIDHVIFPKDLLDQLTAGPLG